MQTATRAAPCGMLRTSLQRTAPRCAALAPKMSLCTAKLSGHAPRNRTNVARDRRCAPITIAASAHRHVAAPSPPPPFTDNLWDTIIQRLSKTAAVMALAAVVALGSAFPAAAARSGGRMGGMAFSGRSSYGSSVGSSMGSMGRAGGSLGGSFGGSRSYGFGSSSRGGAGWRGRSGGSPSLSFNSVTPLAFLSPFGYGGGGGGLMSLLFWGLFAAILVPVVMNVFNGASGGDGGGGELIGGGEKLTVAKVQVGLLVSARDLQRDLERIAAKADTSTPKGLHYVLQETVLSLMRNPDYCVYAFARAGVERSADAAESRFNKLSMEERGKFEKETLVNVGGRTGSSTLGRGRGGGGGGRGSAPVGELIVVTILVACEGRVKLPKVASRLELKEALATLGALRAGDILAVEVLWTPEEEGDYFTTDDLAHDYPLLNTL